MKKGYQKQMLVAVGMLTAIMMGCTKERPYDAPVKPEDTYKSKSLVVEAGKGSKPVGDKVPDDVYLYLPSTVTVFRSQSVSRPHWIGEVKLVKLKFTEKNLNVVQIEKDDRFNDNDMNNAPVLTVPVQHVEYVCAPDADGKCTNREEDTNKLQWYQKTHFIVDTNNMNVDEKNFFPEQLRTNCFTPTKTEFKSYSLEDAGMNIQIDKTYTTSLAEGCLAGITDLSQLTFKVRYQYSLIKLNKLHDPNYKPFKYIKGEENVFGFFTTEDVKLHNDNNTTEDSETIFLNRWNPGSKIKYHLSANFNKPENASLKLATQSAVDTINNSLKAAGSGLSIDIVEPKDGELTEGDLRKSSIVLEESPLSIGLIGYGPSIADPMTGQLLAARTVMYTGTLKKYIKESWDDLVIDELAKSKKATGTIAAPAADVIAIAESGKGAQTPARLTFTDAMKRKVELAKKMQSEKMLSGLLKTDVKSVANSKANFSNSDITRPVNVAKAAADAKNNRLLTLKTSDLQGKIDNFLRENCMYQADQFNFDAAIEGEVTKLLAKLGDKMWLELTEAERTEVMDTLLPFAYTPTLIHEIGHTLGLRHNFGASEDKDNFYTEQEIKDMGLTRMPKYSSVMDYAYKTTNELHVMGKYDIAALRFGYAEQVEAKDGSMISVAKYRADKAELKPYKFCTDEHVGINPNCNTFDEGTTLTEIAEAHVANYKAKYYKRNFRNKRLSYSVMTDSAYAGGVNYDFASLRSDFERYESIKKTYGLADDDKIWETNAFLKDLKGAVKVAASFLGEVLLTPDLSCAVATAKDPSQIVVILPLKQLSANAITCFDSENVGLNPEYVIVAQGGKSFKSMKDPNSKNNYLDQIDVRGIWIDKLLALNTLVKRVTGIESYDEFHDNMLDIADLAGPAREVLEQIVSDDVIANITLVTKEGDVLAGQINTQFYNPDEGKNGHLIMKPLEARAQQIFGITDHTLFQSKVISVLKSTLSSREQDLDPTSLLNGLDVIKLKATDGALQKDYVAIQIGKDVYAAHKTAGTALGTMDNFTLTSLLGTVGQEKVMAIYKDVAAGKPAPATATDDEKVVYGLKKEVLEKFLGGGFQAPIFYAEMIKAMSKKAVPAAANVAGDED